MTRRRSPRPSLAVVLASIGFASPARADGGADIELRYTRAAGAERCPDEAGLRDAVLAHLGYNPFVEGGARKIVVNITRRGKGLTAQIDRIDEHGAIAGTRTVDSTAVGCRELASSVALAVTIAIDPLYGSPLRPPTPPESSPERIPPPARLARTEPTAEAPSSLPPPPSARKETSAHEETLRVNVGAGVVGALGAAPSPSIGATGELRVRARSFSVGAGFRLDAPASGTANGASGGRIASSLLVGSLVPCAHFGRFAVCASAHIGALSGNASEVARTERHSTFFSAAGGRVAMAVPFGNLFALGVYVEALGTLTPTTLRIDRREAWSIPPASAAVGLQATANVL